MNGDSIHIGIVDEPNDLIREKLSVVLRVEIGLRRLTRVELQALSDSLTKDVEGWVCLHNLGHGLLEKGLSAIEPCTIATVQVVSKIDCENRTSWRRVDRHVVSCVVVKHSSCVPVDLMTVIIAPTKLDINPVLGRDGAIVLVSLLVKQRRLADLPLVGGKEENICTTGVHLVTLARMDSLFLDCFDL